MGKGFNNYMCKKFFHPASRDNLKRVWIAEQNEQSRKAKELSLKLQYEKEQELYKNKSLISKESKEKLELSFMYEPPPGVQQDNKELEKHNNEVKYKFDWQRNWGSAPRESWVSKDALMNDKPFGIPVRHVKCLKCGKYGHINTDKECRLYGKAKDSQTPFYPMDQEKLAREMKEDGMSFRWSVWDKSGSEKKPYEAVSEPENRELKVKEKKIHPEKMIAGMNRKEKLRLLQKIEKMERKSRKKAKLDKNDDKNKRIERIRSRSKEVDPEKLPSKLRKVSSSKNRKSYIHG